MVFRIEPVKELRFVGPGPKPCEGSGCTMPVTWFLVIPCTDGCTALGSAAFRKALSQARRDVVDTASKFIDCLFFDAWPVRMYGQRTKPKRRHVFFRVVNETPRALAASG